MAKNGSLTAAKDAKQDESYVIVMIRMRVISLSSLLSILIY